MKPILTHSQFSEKDIADITNFINIKDTFTFPEEPIDRRTISQQVQDFCLEAGILEKRGRRLYRAIFGMLSLYEKLPIEVLYELVKPILTRKCVGYEVVTDPQWTKLGLYLPMSKRPSKSHIEYIVSILSILHRGGYVTFKHIGDVWEIAKEV